MLKVPDYREISIPINRQIIIDQVAAFLYAAGYVYDDEEVIDIQFAYDINIEEIVHSIVKIKKQQQVEVLTY